MSHTNLPSPAESLMLKALDPDTRQLLALAKEAGYPPFQDLSPVKAREMYAAGWSVMQSDGGEVASVKDIEIPSEAGSLKLRVYRGLGTDSNHDLPCMLFLHGATFLIVEHDIPVIMDISDKIVVLDFGRKIAEGTASEVQNNPLVIAAYLGDEH